MIIVECYNDVTLLEVLGLNRKQEISHAGSISKVLQIVDQTNSEALGIIDEDPNQAIQPRLRNYTQIERINRIRLLENPEKPTHQVIVIPINNEEWLKTMGQNLGIKLEEYNILRINNKFFKRYQGSRLIQFKRFIHDLNSHPEFKALNRWVSPYKKNLSSTRN